MGALRGEGPRWSRERTDGKRRVGAPFRVQLTWADEGLLGRDALVAGIAHGHARNGDGGEEVPVGVASILGFLHLLLFPGLWEGRETLREAGKGPSASSVQRAGPRRGPA